MSNALHEVHSYSNSLTPFILQIETQHKNTFYWPANWHSDLEIICCIKGSGDVLYNNEVHSMKKGDVFVVNSNVLHSTQTNELFIFYCIIITEEFCKENFIDISNISFQEDIKDPQLFNFIKGIFDEFKDFFTPRKAMSNPPVHIALKMRSRIVYLLAILCEKYSSQFEYEEKNRYVSERAKKVITYLRNNYKDHISLEELAEYSGINKYTLSREFKQITGYTIWEYLNLIRCQKAQQLILNNVTVKESAFSVGFNNMSYFAKTFKKCIGCMPSELKNKSQISKRPEA